ncbi:uncharacterized protein LOC108163038 [Drosophila miranda]|uniref:uncharacterized protein LOC108163038 n=1 Tax=Drosophila miranda TaxID=7229 RepID=UPI0007E767A0|nr:uncharacterized protein LOC108163038 [Drosophila miranda]
MFAVQFSISFAIKPQNINQHSVLPALRYLAAACRPAVMSKRHVHLPQLLNCCHTAVLPHCRTVALLHCLLLSSRCLAISPALRSRSGVHSIANWKCNWKWNVERGRWGLPPAAISTAPPLSRSSCSQLSDSQQANDKNQQGEMERRIAGGSERGSKEERWIAGWTMDDGRSTILDRCNKNRNSSNNKSMSHRAF